MKNRSYIGDGVYASFNIDGHIVVELEQGRPIILNKSTFHALIEYIQKNNAMFDPNCQLVEVPHVVYEEVLKDLRELEAVAQRGGTKLQ